jgi:hypothetical protein
MSEAGGNKESWTPSPGYGGFILNDHGVGLVISIDEIIDWVNVIMEVADTVTLTC